MMGPMVAMDDENTSVALRHPRQPDHLNADDAVIGSEVSHVLEADLPGDRTALGRGPSSQALPSSASLVDATRMQILGVSGRSGRVLRDA
jgi:hypothetical protein